MNELNLLRNLAEQQKYSELTDMATLLWEQTYDPAILPLWALASFQVGAQQQADDLYQQASVHYHHLDIDSRCDLAAVLIVMEQVAEAKALLLELWGQQPQHGLVLARLGYCYLIQDDDGKAQVHFEQSLALEPERVIVRSHLINVYIRAGFFESAQAQLEQALAKLEQQTNDFYIERYQLYWSQLTHSQLQLWVKTHAFAEAEQWLQQLSKQQQAGQYEQVCLIESLKYYAQLLVAQDLHNQAIDILREYIKVYNEDCDLYSSLSELVLMQGHFSQGINLLQKALKLEPDNVELWIKLSSACLHRVDNKARYAAEKALELALLVNENEQQSLGEIKLLQVQAKNALALVESHQQNFVTSEALYREILVEQADFVSALQGLAQQLMQQGKIEEALTLFEQIKVIDPIRGYSALINARRFPDQLESLVEMEQAALTPSLEGSVRSGILFQLAAAWEKRKDYKKAFEFAKQANDASKKFLPYDAKNHRNQCARLRSRFSKALYQHRPDYGVDSTLPVFILGMPRSGTTLVEQIIAGHSDIFGAGELDLIPQVIQGLMRWERHTGSGRTYPDCIDDLTAQASEGIANNVLAEMQELAQETKPNAKHVVDKLPHNFENIGLIKFLFPNAKIISVRRDTRDIAMSNYFTDYQAKHGGMGFAYDLENIGQQLADHNLLMHHWHQTFPGEILELNYEDVVDDLEGSARKMLSYIGVEWQPQVLKFNELERTVKTASVWQVRQPIYKTSKAKWKRYQRYLAPLIKGTNANIAPEPIDDMLTLPVAGFLTDGVALYKTGDLDGAELSFKKMLHHNPQHAACNYMLGLVYMSKHHPKDGVALMKQALEITPWHEEWKLNLIKGYELLGEETKANELRESCGVGMTPINDELDINFTTLNFER
jgi:tetratricopeptide (TPR) repeat protein